MDSPQRTPLETGPDAGYEILIVGAGFAGLYALQRLRSAGFSVHAVEAGTGVGGTWYWNRYPGARCDVESLQYSYSFSEELQQEWVWSERYATQPEILAYLEHVAERFDLRRDISFNTRVSIAAFDMASNLWTLEMQNGARLQARFCIMATGSLSASRLPAIEGLEAFEGPVHHTGRWPKETVDLTGKNVGVIGTGSSGIQVIPALAQQVKRLVVFQRTPAFSVPAHNVPLTAEKLATWKREYKKRREDARNTRSGMLFEYGTRAAAEVSEAERQQEFERRWAVGGTNFLYAYTDIMRNDVANAWAANFVREKIATTVNNPRIAAALIPHGFPIGAKRICVDSGYHATYNRDNVELVDIRASPIEKITANAIVTQDAEYPLDAIVCATGYDAITGALLAMNIRGKAGLSLQEKWGGGPLTYLGLMVAGFPNMFIVAGAGSPSVLSNVVGSIEHHVNWIAHCLTYLRASSALRIEATLEAETAWVTHVNEVAATTLYPKAASWYMGANIPGKPQVFMPYIGGVANYERNCREVAEAGYRGFDITYTSEVRVSPA